MKNTLGLQTMVRTQTALAAMAGARKRAAQRFADDRGAAMAEYGLLLALVALVAVGILAFFGGEIVEVFTDAEKTLAERDEVPDPD